MTQTFKEMSNISMLSLDPGIRNTGWADWRGEELKEWGTIVTPRKYKGFDALTYQNEGIVDLLCGVWVDELVVEGYYPRSAKKSMMHGIMLVGGIVSTGMATVNRICIYTPAQWKRWAKEYAISYNGDMTQHEYDAIMLGRFHLQGGKASEEWKYRYDS